MAVVIAIDAGTTGVRSFAVDEHGSTQGWSYREFTQHFPRPGWVEHDADEIWDGGRRPRWPSSRRPRRAGRRDRHHRPARDRRWCGTGAPASPGTGHRLAGPTHRRPLRRARRGRGHLDLVRRPTGLVLDPYFSGTKIEWLLGPTVASRRRRPGARHHRRLAALEADRRRGARHRAVERQPHDAVRHPRRLAWSDELCRPARRAARRAPRGAADAAAGSGSPTDDVPTRRRHPDQRHRRRPAGGAVRPGLLHARA